MAREEHILGCNISGGGSGGSGGDGGVSSGGRLSSEKTKQKKVPQRGLGVAQLEKIRLEEQQKMVSLEALNVLGRNSIDSPSDITQLPVSCPGFRSVVPSLYNSVSSTLIANLPSPNALYRQAPPFPGMIRSDNPVQNLKQLNGNRGEVDFKMVMPLGHGAWPRLWNGEYSLVGEKQRVEYHGFGCEAQVTLPYDLSNPPVSTPPPIVSKRSPHQFQQLSSPLMVNPSPGISRSLVLRLPIEPHSNQSSRGDNYTTSWSEEDNVVGAKRSYPFSLESPQTSCLHRNVCSTYASPISRSDELGSSSNGHRAHIEPKNKCIRADPMSSTALPKWDPSEVTRDNQKLSGDFLTLAPPAFGCPPSDSKHKRCLEFSGEQGTKLPEFESMLSLGLAKNQTYQPGNSGSTEQSSSFFPVKYRTDNNASYLSYSNGDNGEIVDLNLKL